MTDADLGFFPSLKTTTTKKTKPTKMYIFPFPPNTKNSTREKDVSNELSALL